MAENNKKLNLARLLHNQHRIIPFILIIIAIVGILAWFLLSGNNSHDLELSGRLEGYETNISPKYGGKIQFIAGREGKIVKKGELLIKIEDSELQAQLKSSLANLEIAKNQVNQSEIQIKILEKQIQQGVYNLNQSKEDTQGMLISSKADLTSAEKKLSQSLEQLKQTESDLYLTTVTYKRLKNLSKNGSVSKQEFDQAESSYNVAIANVEIKKQEINIAKNRIKMAEGSLIRSNSTLYTSAQRKEQIDILNSQLKQAKSQLESSKLNVTRAKADIQLLKAQINYLNITSPISGVIISRTTEPGEVAATGRILLTLLDYNSVYLRGYIPEGNIGLVKIGQKAKVFLDSAPKKPLSAAVSEIDSVASFTPENIYFKNERVKQVFGIKLTIDNPSGYAKPGMPADATILTKEN
jgi:HlyD family secretion protein